MNDPKPDVDQLAREYALYVYEGYSDEVKIAVDDAYQAGWNAHAALASQPAVSGENQLPADGAYLIRFDDAEREDRLFAGSGAKDAALRYYREASVSWNAHLFVKIDSNSRDCKIPNAAIPMPPRGDT